MAYVTQSEVSYALGIPIVLAIFDDDQDGIVDGPALDAVIARASAMTDSWIAPVYKGPFPIVQVPIPALIKELTLQYVEAMCFDRRPDIVRGFGSDDAQKRWPRADDMGKKLQAAILRIPDYVAQPKPANVGGISVANTANVITQNTDGTPNMGDF
jgi:hypothetical protein